MKPPLFVSVHPIRSVPKKSCSVATNELLRPLCPEECSVYGGVGISGSHAGIGHRVRIAVGVGFP